MSADDTMAPVHQHTSEWQPWTHCCGHVLCMALRTSGYVEFPLWRTVADVGVAKCPQCGAWLRADQEQPRPL